MESLDWEENVVFYQLFSDACISSYGDEAASSSSSSSSLPQPLLQHFTETRLASLDLLEPLTRSYIWQHDPFNLAIASQTPPPLKRSLDREQQLLHQTLGIDPPPPSSSSAAASSVDSSDDRIPHLFGKVKYGDNVEDEWFVVYLLFELSRQFSSLSIRVWDSDGEFLLIEAAYAIPRWLKPENSRNRVFIRDGGLHILPMPSSPADIYRLPIRPSLTTALQLIKEGMVETRASLKIQAAIQKRLAGYPERARMNMHRARCQVPLPVAQVLKLEPQLVSLAVEAFYNRDLDSMKAVARMEKFLPKSSDGQPEMVNIVVTMSRAMYAQLMQQTFQAPRCYPMPAFSPRYKDAEIGMKLTCGFEMMYRERSRYQHVVEKNVEADSAGTNSENGCSIRTGQVEGREGQGNVSAVNHTSIASLQSDVGWQAFYRSLQSRGYFRDLIEGSQEHRKLMQSAIARYKQTSLFSRVSAAMRAPVIRIDEILSLPFSVLDFPDVDLQETDDDSWLYSGEDDLENALHERQKEIDAYEEERGKHRQSKKLSKAGSSADGGELDKENYDPQELVNSMKAFVESISSFEGAEIPGIDKNCSLEDKASTRKLMRELKGTLGLGGEDLDFDEADSSDFSMESDDIESGESDLEGEGLDSYAKSDQLSGIGRAKLKVSLENDLETSPVRHTDDTFMEEYSQVLQQELKKTSLAKTFARIDDTTSTSSLLEHNQEVGQRTEDVEPVDMNYNLVKNILESYASQHGMPGPASNLLGAMGLQLPDDLREHDEKSKS